MKQRIAILAVMLALIGGYLWWQGRPADGSILYGNVDIRDVNLAFRVGGRVNEVLVDEVARPRCHPFSRTGVG